SGAVWWSNKREKANEGKPASDASPKILTLAEDSIRQIEIKHRDSEATVLRRDDANRWSIIAPKPLSADQSSVSSLAGGVSSLSWGRGVDDKVTALAAYGLAPASIELTFTMKDGKTSKLLVGDDTPSGSAVYANAGDSRLFTMASYNKNTFDKT